VEFVNDLITIDDGVQFKFHDAEKSERTKGEKGTKDRKQKVRPWANKKEPITRKVTLFKEDRLERKGRESAKDQTRPWKGKIKQDVHPKKEKKQSSFGRKGYLSLQKHQLKGEKKRKRIDKIRQGER